MDRQGIEELLKQKEDYKDLGEEIRQREAALVRELAATEPEMLGIKWGVLCRRHGVQQKVKARYK